MATTISPQDQLEKTYNAAADHYDHPALSFWDRFGMRTVERLPLAPGMEVLDVCCGMGGSALPAAERVGLSGHVVAVDLAQNLLDKGARRAAQRGLANIEFRRADLENLPFADASFDAVICVFGIFFVPDLRGAIQGLWRLVRPAGVLAITIWGAMMRLTILPPEMKAMTDNRADLDPSSWDPALDAVVAAPKHHKVLFENERLRVLEVTLEPNDEEPVHHHSVAVGFRLRPGSGTSA